ncbi:hypothetical protein Rsub_08245 [Raphidocelis subcapitata]|uniref:Pherophorin domain-containing protein n=1 Tax=Raphidocelis subcapitata TaxID=307507 RepID=A0A2V0P8B9_9CHLO|nr:hypothetical protein Rsub_08245 [Raphidocelis subcapitata]|eukprot:GBF95809.1 hypothetical protein Rsub_08245 [Raphidocelis subcapitata]
MRTRSRGAAPAAARALPLLLAALLLAAAPPAARAQPGAFQQPMSGASASMVSSSSSSSVSSSSSSSVGPRAAALNAPPACTNLVKTSTSSCAGGVCCDIAQRVTACPDHTTAVADINGAPSACCVVLVSKKTGLPTPFCATAKPRNGARTFPARVAVSLDPRCAAAPGGAAAASLACSARFEKLPHGYALPAKSGVAVSMAAGKAGPWAARGLSPCQGAFTRFTQTATVEKGTRATLFSVQCAA